MKTNETGRSMVEMLGVLAIIGVLSIGGIAGYTTAMNRYRANEILDMATKYATIAFSANETHKAMNGGTGLGEDDVPTFCETGLNKVASDTTCKVNGATIGDADVSTEGKVTIEIDFGTGNENVCKAAASSLGVSCTSNKVSFEVVQS